MGFNSGLKGLIQ